MFRLLTGLFAVALLLYAADDASAQPNMKARRMSQTIPWHGNYYHWQYGQPLALVVPPIANTQTSWGWGVAQTEVNSLHHQFKRPYPGEYGGGDFSRFRPTPYWPSHTDQFGVYAIRGPWGHY